MLGRGEVLCMSMVKEKNWSEKFALEDINIEY